MSLFSARNTCVSASHIWKTLPRRCIAVSSVASSSPSSSKPSFSDLKTELEELIRIKNAAPLLLSLPWHHSGKFGGFSQTENPNSIAASLLDPLRAKYQHISHLDFVCFAAVVAIEVLGGPSISFQPGRTDDVIFDNPTDGNQGASHIRQLFDKYGFSDQEMVALMGAHGVGRCHAERSGFDGHWTPDTLSFNNDYFLELIGEEWIPVESSKGRTQFRDSEGNIMLNTDIALIKDPKFRKWVEIYAKDKEKFFEDFKNAFEKLINSYLTMSQKQE